MYEFYVKPLRCSWGYINIVSNECGFMNRLFKTFFFSFQIINVNRKSSAYFYIKAVFYKRLRTKNNQNSHNLVTHVANVILRKLREIGIILHFPATKQSLVYVEKHRKVPQSAINLQKDVIGQQWHFCTDSKS